MTVISALSFVDKGAYFILQKRRIYLSHCRIRSIGGDIMWNVEMGNVHCLLCNVQFSQSDVMVIEDWELPICD